MGKRGMVTDSTEYDPETVSTSSGTKGSNPPPSSGESCATRPGEIRHRALRLDVLSWRQGHAGRERLRQGRLQRRSWRRVGHRYGRRRAQRRFESVLAYATTIHKSQGSEYPAVVIPLSIQHYPMLQRNLVYTGVTRGKRLVVLVGQRKALAIAVKGARARRRWSKLREWLAAAFPLTC